MPELTLRAKPSDQIKIHNAWRGKTSEEGNYSIDSGLNMLMAFSLRGSLWTASLDAPCLFLLEGSCSCAIPTLCRNPRLFACEKTKPTRPSAECAGPKQTCICRDPHANTQNHPCREFIPNTQSHVGMNPLRINNSSFLKRFNSPQKNGDAVSLFALSQPS